MNTLYLKRTIANKCPRCGEGQVLDGVFVRRDTCPVCELKYDRGEDGFFLGGVPVGTTDELGSRAVDDKFHVRRLHATILNQLGLDPNNLSFFHGGLDKSLVGVEGAEPIKQIIS